MSIDGEKVEVNPLYWLLWYPTFTKWQFFRPVQIESKLKAFADNKINVAEKLKFVWEG